MIRKYNYTGRLKISKDKVRIYQFLKDGVRFFEVKLMVNDLGFPDHAKIYIEPYFKSSFMRFAYGTIARITTPSQTLLTDIPITDKVLYRLKIVDESKVNGLILGYSDELIASTGDKKGGKSSLLPVDFNDLGNRIWKLDFRQEGPVLSVNSENKIEKIRELVTKDKSFLSLVFPEVIRQIAFHLANDQDLDFTDPGNGWESKWLRFFDEYLSISHEPEKNDETSKSEWSDEIAEAFCRKKQIIDLLIS